MSSGTGLPVDNVKLAVAVIVLAVLALSFGDALIKESSAELVIWQIFVLRSAAAVVVLAAILRLRYAAVSFMPRAPGWTTARSLMLVAMWIAYYASLPHLQFSVAAAAFYTLPIFITLFSAPLAGERVGKAGWFAVVLGFAGVLLVLRPAADGFNAYALLPLASAVLYALAMILTRTKCRGEHPLILSAALNVGFIAVGAAATLAGLTVGDTDILPAFLSTDWAPLTGDVLFVLGVMTSAILIGSIGAAVAYQMAPSSVVGTFDFAYVGFAVIWGVVLFGEFPDAVAVIGMIMIVAAGIIAVRR